MNIKHLDIEIPDKEPFKNCQLGREKYASIITDIVNTYSDGFVLAINNEWGTGKTTFVDMWRKHLKLNGFKTLHFNAWENDFESNPLIPVMSELEKLKDDKNQESFKSLLKSGGKITKSIIPGIVKAVAERYIDSGMLVEALKNSAEAGGDIMEEELQKYIEKKKSLQEFKEELTKYVASLSDDKPIVFIVDELDRCRPSYAVEVLEQIKHFFSVKGIVFVLSIDKIQLGHAIRGVYGSEQINSEEYLRRFIDVEYSLPEPNTEDFCKYLFDYFNFEEFFHSEQRSKIKPMWRDSKNLLKISTDLFTASSLTLRQQEKIFAHTRIVLNSFEYNYYVFPVVLIFLVYARTHESEFYKKLQSKEFTWNELTMDFKNIISLPDSYLRDERLPFIQLEAYLLNLYNNYCGKNAKLIGANETTDEPVYNVSSRIDNSENQEDFRHILRRIRDDWDTKSTSIDYLLDRINLSEPIKV